MTDFTFKDDDSDDDMLYQYALIIIIIIIIIIMRREEEMMNPYTEKSLLKNNYQYLQLIERCTGVSSFQMFSPKVPLTDNCAEIFRRMRNNWSR